MSGSCHSARAKSEINVTPLVDVILVLVVVFLVITPQLVRGFSSRVPPPGKGGPQTAALVLEVSASGALHLNRQPVPEPEVGERVAAALVGQPQRLLYLKVEDGVAYESLVEILDTCYRSGGVQSVAFMLE